MRTLMETQIKLRRGMTLVLGLFLFLFLFKMLVHGLREGLLFAPALGLWLLATTVVYWFTKDTKASA